MTFDWSKYQKISTEEPQEPVASLQTEGQPFDWSKYEKLPQEEKPRGLLEQAGRALGFYGKSRAIYGTPIGFATELAGQALETAISPSQQYFNWKQTTLDNIEDLETQKAFGQWSPEQEEQLAQFKTMYQMSPEEVKALGGIQEPIPIAPTSLIKAGGEALGYNVEPETVTEKILDIAGFGKVIGTKGSEKAGEFIFKNLEKKLPEFAIKEGKNLIAAAPVATAATGIEEKFGVPSSYSLAAFGLSQAGLAGGKYAASKVGKKFFLFDPTNISLRSPLESFKKEAKNAKVYAQEQLEKGIMSAEKYEQIVPFLDKAIEMGIPINPSAMSDSKYFKSIERMIISGEHTEEQVSKLRQEAANAWADTISKVMKKTEGEIALSSPEAAVNSLTNEVTYIRNKKLKEEYSSLYKESKDAVKEMSPIDVQYVDEIENSLNRVLEARAESLIPTSAEKATKEIIKGGKKRLIEEPSAELKTAKFPTGETEIAATKKAEAEKVKNAIADYRQKKISHEKAQEKLESLRRKKGKRKAKVEEEEKLREAVNAEKTAKRNLIDAKKNIEIAKGKKPEIQKINKETLNEIFGEESKNLIIDDNGYIKFRKRPTNAELISTIQSLNKTIEWDNPSIKNLLTDTLQTFKIILGKTLGKENPVAYNKYIEANKKFKESVELFGQDGRWKKWGIGSQSTPEELLKDLNTPEKFARFEKDFGNTQRGKIFIDELKRQKMKEILTPIFDKITYSPGQIARNIQSLKNNKYFRYITPKETWKNIEELQQLDAHLQRTGSKFFSKPSPQQASSITFFGGIWQLVEYITFKKLLQNKSIERRSEIFAEIFTDPSYTKKMKDIGEKVLKEAEKGNPKKSVLDTAISEMKILQKNMKESSKPALSAAGKRKTKEILEEEED